MDLETRINRKNTTAFIAKRPSTIVLTPQNKVETAAGGYKLEKDFDREPQVFRIIELGANQSPPILTLTDGKQREAEFWLLGEWDAEIAVNDYWVAEDRREWLVGDLVRSNGYEVRALVTERGK